MIGQQPLLKVPVAAGRREQRWRAAAVCLVLAAITFAVFGQTLTHGFIDYDDSEYVYDNPVLDRGMTIGGIVWAFTHVHSANWHPLTWLSHMLDCQLYGLHPAGHHLTNVLLHTATVIALFLVLRQMTGTLWRSAFVAAVFAIHPLRVESVAWVAERKDVLSGLFFMLTIGAYVRYARRPWSPVRYGLVVLLFAMGLMCKPMLVTLPVVLLLLDYWPLQRVEPRKLSGRVLEKLPLLALSAASCGATLLAQNKAIQSTESYSLPLRFGNALVACMVYLVQMIWPAGLAAFYPRPLNGASAWELGLAGTLLAGLSAVALGRRGKQSWLLVGWLWYLVMLLPVLGLIQVGGQSHADRYTYLPQIGIYMALTWLGAEWGAKLHVGHMAIGGLMAGVLAVLMVCAWQQTAYWKDNETLWTHSLACTTDNYVAQYGLGDALFQKGRVDEAITHYQAALQISPAFAQACNNLGVALGRKARVEEAIACYQKALKIKPDYAEARNNLGSALFRQGRTDEAISQFQKALKIKPDYAQARNNLAWLLATCPQASLRNGNKAVELARQANALTGGENPGFLDTLAAAYAEAGRFSEAVETAHHALRLAGAQSNTNLAGQLQIEMKLYQAGKPFHFAEQTH
jgi:tetratricopeptide (TPR) repeat protein